LSAILDSTHEHRLGPLEKLSTVSEYAFGDVIGLLTLLGLAFAVFRTADVAVGGPAGWTAGGPSRRILWWCVAMVVAFTAWLPVAYPRYVLLVIPPLCIAADFGYRHLMVKGGEVAARWRRSA
jgi:hypothetical protein